MKKDAIHSSWWSVMEGEFELPYFQQIEKAIKQDIVQGNTVYPKGSDIFSAFNLTHFNEVKVVILGQDPYHGEGQAHGLSFSVPRCVGVPPSLNNIFNELGADFNISFIPQHGDLSSWAKQGVLLLNASLTVIRSKPMSHAHIGWQTFTDSVIAKISLLREHVVFLLWGSFAQQKKQFINMEKHLVLTAPHPSPLSAHRGFLGCKHFSKTNAYLKARQLIPIEWFIF